MIMQRLVYLDIARAWCIILVVVGHYIPDSAPQYYQVLHHVIYTFHMPLFLFISGYIYAKQPSSKYRSFIGNKAKRLLIPYVFTSVLLITIKLLTAQGMQLENAVSAAAFYEMGYRPVAGFFLWFIYALFLIFLFIPLFQTKRQRYALLAASLLILLLPVEMPDILCLPQLKGHLFYFVLGCCATDELIHKHLTRKLMIPLAAILALVFLYRSTPESLTIQRLMLSGLGVGGIALSLWLSHQIATLPPYIKRPFLYLAPYTFTIYLFHTTFEGFAKAALGKFPMSGIMGAELGFIAEACLVITCGVVCPIIVHNAMKRHAQTRTLIGISENTITKQ